ncbi:hypothetical protein CYMTET_8457 [Cymbomonas tetramitiformis]|uniref:Uncharacterized protein n=1 Tax=Cymbomonas tetramitiformis TaxID=36881 RepID=A0AAE0LFU0_9CHLO|nr:hypothetical protein CYMTET_8457 [Cymbomonas tetramitiformis]
MIVCAGTLTAEKAKGWAKSAWQSDRKPIGAEEGPTVVARAAKSRNLRSQVGHVTVASFLEDSDDEDELEEVVADRNVETCQDDFAKYNTLLYL